MVGSNAVTAPVIEASYHRFLSLFDAHLRQYPYLMGNRPGASDFAVFGQLTQLTHFDPTPMALTLATAPRVFAWVDLIEDLSGAEPADADWITGDNVPPTLRALLAELACGYVPVMIANAAALRAGADRVETLVDGKPWVQQPFPYQGKCLLWLRESFARLGEDDQRRVSDLLDEAGCRALLSN